MSSRIPGPCPQTKKKSIKEKKQPTKDKKNKKRVVTFEDIVTFESDELKTDQTDKFETFSKNDAISDLAISDLQKRVEDRIKKLELPKMAVESLEAENKALRQRVSALEARSNELLQELSICKGLLNEF